MGTVSGAQTAAKGGSAGDVAESALAGAVTGGATEGISSGLTGAIKEASPVETEVAGQKFTTPRPAEVPAEVQKAQTAGKQVIAQSAQDAAARNVIRDVPTAIAKTSSFGDAADEVEKSAKGAYDNLNNATGGKFSEVRDDFNLARKEVYRAGSVGERDAAQIRLDNATTRMRQLFNDTGGKVSQQDWKDANTAWTNSKTLRQVHDAVESTFDTDAGFSQRSGTYRGCRGARVRRPPCRQTRCACASPHPRTRAQGDN